MFTFDASKSYDPDGNITSYEWFCTDFNISLYKGKESTLTLPAQRPIGVYETKLIVTDDQNATSEDSVLVKIVEPVFVAEAGENFQVEQGTTYKLNASESFYKNGNIKRYQWIMVDTNETLYEGSRSITPPIAAPADIGKYDIKLIVTDDLNRTKEDVVSIFVVENSADNQFQDIYATKVTIGQFKVLQENDKVYIDIRRADEWAKTGIINGSHQITKPDNIDEWLEEGSAFRELVTDKEQTFVLICAVGGRAHRLSTQLLNKGYTHVHYLEGGIDAWIEAGEPVVSAE